MTHGNAASGERRVVVDYTEGSDPSCPEGILLSDYVACLNLCAISHQDNS